jgi:hypothetical protein
MTIEPKRGDQMKRNYSSAVASSVLAVLLLAVTPASAQISLGTSDSFAVLGGSTVTNTGPSAITGNVGVSPGSSVTGFPPGVIAGGTIHSADGVALQAQSDLTVAYNAAAGTACNVDLTGQDLGGLTLTPGVYCFSTSAFLTGTLTLDMQGNPNAFFLFKIGSTLITANGSTVVLANTTALCPPNVFWQVGSSATFGTGSTFKGNVLALTSITLTTTARLDGRALARNGAVTLDTNTVGACAPLAVCPLITVNPATLPDGAVGTLYNQLVTASGGTGPYTFAVTSGALPGGIVLAPAGTLSGTPTTAGTFDFTITATDTSTGCMGSRPYTLNIASSSGCPVITLSPASLPSGTIGVLYNQTISASGGAPPTTFTVTSGALPAGLVLNLGTGAITGVPSATGLFSFTVRATDSGACFGSRPYSILINAAPAGGVPALDFTGLILLIVVLGGVGLFAMNRLS